MAQTFLYDLPAPQDESRADEMLWLVRIAFACESRVSEFWVFFCVHRSLIFSLYDWHLKSSEVINTNPCYHLTCKFVYNNLRTIHRCTEHTRFALSGFTPEKQNAVSLRDKEDPFRLVTGPTREPPQRIKVDALRATGRRS